MCEICMIKKLKKTPQSLLRRFKLCVGKSKKRTFRFTKHIASFYFFGTFRFADYNIFRYLCNSTKKITQ